MVSLSLLDLALRSLDVTFRVISSCRCECSSLDMCRFSSFAASRAWEIAGVGIAFSVETSDSWRECCNQQLEPTKFGSNNSAKCSALASHRGYDAAPEI